MGDPRSSFLVVPAHRWRCLVNRAGKPVAVAAVASVIVVVAAAAVAAAAAKVGKRTDPHT